ncbi:MAG: hypothetical protein U9Q71_04700 [Pseudomonadota bacterium]|nr:hypothetical protein [Pseudomonadota bacterium]
MNKQIVGFSGRTVALSADTDWLAEQLRDLFRHLMEAGSAEQSSLLSLHLYQLGDDYFELEDSAGRRERGSLEYLLHYAREWSTRAFIAASRNLLWLHAGGAVSNGLAVLLPGPAGSGKSTLTAQLVAQGWSYLADDIVPVDCDRNRALPFPFTPAVRTVPHHEDGDWHTFLEQEKVRVDIQSERVCNEPTPVGGIVFPEYLADAPGEGTIEPMTSVAATHELVSQCVRYDARKEQTIAKLFGLVCSVPSFRLTYSDPVRAVGRIAQRLPSASHNRPDEPAIGMR